MQRRVFLTGAAASLYAATSSSSTDSVNISINAKNVSKLKGFNFDYFYKFGVEKALRFGDIDFIALHGFGIIRLVFDYRVFCESVDPVVFSKEKISQLDEVIKRANSRGLHVVLAMHRAPGYCVNPPYEPVSLWRDMAPQRAFFDIWRKFANRYRDVPDSLISFNLVNEPPGRLADSVYFGVMVSALNEIRTVSSRRLVVLDGLAWAGREFIGDENIPDLIFSGRGYFPMDVTHYQAEWVRKPEYPLSLAWPPGTDHQGEGSALLYENINANWGATIKHKLPFHIGEWGVYNKTPHAVALALMGDYLHVFDRLGLGWMLWNFRGPFGVVDSGRKDVNYERFDGGVLDEKMLSLLTASLNS